MADLTTTIQESVVINGSLRGSTNSVTTSGINDVFERIVTCTASVVTTIAVFDTLPSTSPGAIDVDRTKYVRITNLDPSVVVELAVVTTADTSPSFGTMENITSLQIQPTTAFPVRVEVFVGIE